MSPKYLEKYIEKLQQEANKRGIDVDVNTLRKEVIKDLEDKETISWFAELAQKAKALYSEQIGTFAEAMLASQKIAKNVWDEGQINQSTWHSKNQEHQQWPKYAQFAPVVGGSTDGVIDEIVGIPMAIKGIYGIMTDEKQRAAIAGVFTQEGMSQLWEDFASESIDILNDKERLTHFGAKSVVQVANTVVLGGVTKGGKVIDALNKAADITKALPRKVKTLLKKLEKTNRYDRKILNAIGDLFAKIDPKLLEKLVDVPGFDKVLEDMAIHWTKFKGGKFQLEYAAKLIDDGAKIKFEVSDLSDDLKRIYDIEVKKIVDEQLITKNLELKNWGHFYPETIKNQLVKDLQKMNELGDIQWIFNKTKGIDNIQTLKTNVLNSLKKADGTPIEEVKKLFDEEDIFSKKISKLFGLDINNSKELIQALEKDNIFNPTC